MQCDASKAVTWINLVTNTACVSYGFPHLIINILRSVVLLFFVNFSISPLTCYAIPLGHSLRICASNGDTDGVYIPFWTSSLAFLGDSS